MTSSFTLRGFGPVGTFILSPLGFPNKAVDRVNLCTGTVDWAPNPSTTDATVAKRRHHKHRMLKEDGEYDDDEVL
eukprot:CAMPEP_0171902286 /NCGR_PEP_ID=MMETSP0993-20121228/1431_1 /TAXON_ID=483369 /ORGANISM="non described non described, Strain CCMP2098" /LENGTH=74 /DNA_ID=CAMNT_0012531609 /DNA_START=465 /DNA_END=686 /DNA_ORIENTATION=-